MSFPTLTKQLSGDRVPVLGDYDATYASRSPGTPRAPSSTGCPTAGSTSPTRRSTAMRRGRAATAWPCASSVGPRGPVIDVDAHLRRARRPHRALRRRARRARRRSRASACSRLLGATARAVRRASSARSSTARCSARCSPPSAPSRSASACSSATARVLVTTPALYRRKVAPIRDAAARPRATCCSSGPGRSGSPTPARTTSHALLAEAADTRRRDAADRPRGPGAAALHQRHHRDAQGRGARARGGRRPPRHRPRGPRPARRRRLLVHGRPGLGHRHVVRHHRAAHLRRDVRRRRAEFDADRWYRILEEQRVTVWYTAPTALRMLMKAGAERAGGARPLRAAPRRQRRRAAQPRGRGVGAGGVRPARSTTPGGRPRPARS